MKDTLSNKNPEQPETESGSSAPPCSLSIYEMARLGMKLPKGTRIRTTRGGVKTRATHEISETLLENVNSTSELFADERPFWCYGWRDFHGDLFLPENE